MDTKICDDGIGPRLWTPACANTSPRARKAEYKCRELFEPLVLAACRGWRFLYTTAVAEEASKPPTKDGEFAEVL